MSRLIATAAGVVAVALLGGSVGRAMMQPGASGAGGTVEWTHWGGDERSTRYSPLEQVNASNFSQLEIAWRWKAHNYGPTPDLIWSSTTTCGTTTCRTPRT